VEVGYFYCFDTFNPFWYILVVFILRLILLPQFIPFSTSFSSFLCVFNPFWGSHFAPVFIWAITIILIILFTFGIFYGCHFAPAFIWAILVIFDHFWVVLWAPFCAYFLDTLSISYIDSLVYWVIAPRRQESIGGLFFVDFSNKKN
jgi:hypothetical protein